MKNSIDSEKILILDFGSQYTQLIARRVREIGVFSEIVSHKISYIEILKSNPKGIILSGGPESVYTKKTLRIDSKILESNMVLLDGKKVSNEIKNEIKFSVENLVLKNKRPPHLVEWERRATQRFIEKWGRLPQEDEESFVVPITGTNNPNRIEWPF